MQNKLFILSFLVFIAGFLRAAQPNDPLVGTYSNGALTMTLQKNGEHYTGTAAVQGQQYPVVLQVPMDAMIQGYYTQDGQQFPIVGTIRDNGLYLIIDGVEFLLQKQSAAAQAPVSAVPIVTQTSGTTTTSSKPLEIAGNDVGDPYLGFKFRPPDGWIAQKTDAGYVLGSRTEKGFILVLPHVYSTLEQVKAAAAEGMVDENGTMLRVSREMQPFGKNGIMAEFSGTVQSQPARGLAIGLLSPFGGGVTVMAVVEQASYSETYAGYVESIANSINFAKSEIPPVVGQWQQQLTNCRLTYLWSYYSSGYGDGSYVGGSQKTIIDLCGQGFFRYSDNNDLAVDGGSGTGYGASGYGSGNSQGNGTWKIVGRGQQAALVLSFHDGRVQEYRLSLQEGKTYLDDKRFFRTYGDDANADFRPQCW